jgi:hypothetical protein
MGERGRSTGVEDDWDCPLFWSLLALRLYR